MQIVQTIASTRLSHGGTSRSVPALCDGLSGLGCDVRLITGVGDGVEGTILPSGATRQHLCKDSGRFGRLLLGRSFATVIETLDAHSLVHDHGLWLATNHAVARICRQRRMTRIVSPRGMAGTWAMNHGRWKKRAAWAFYQRRDLESATGFHATSQQEADEIRELGLHQPIAVIANGVTTPSLPQRTRVDGRTRVLFMSRIHPKKGLLNLLEAWRDAGLPENWELVLAGPDEAGYQLEVEQHVKRLELNASVKFIGPVSDTYKWQVYVDADYFILPSFNENFGIVIAEALSARLPVITTTGTPWSDIAHYGCGWWVDPTIEPLRVALQAAAAQSLAERQAMGARGRDYVTNRYSWRKTAEEMLEFYKYLQNDGAGQPPDFVILK